MSCMCQTLAKIQFAAQSELTNKAASLLSVFSLCTVGCYCPKLSDRFTEENYFMAALSSHKWVI